MNFFYQIFTLLRISMATPLFSLYPTQKASGRQLISFLTYSNSSSDSKTTRSHWPPFAWHASRASLKLKLDLRFRVPLIGLYLKKVRWQSKHFRNYCIRSFQVNDLAKVNDPGLCDPGWKCTILPGSKRSLAKSKRSCYVYGLAQENDPDWKHTIFTENIRLQFQWNDRKVFQS